MKGEITVEPTDRQIGVFEQALDSIADWLNSFGQQEPPERDEALRHVEAMLREAYAKASLGEPSQKQIEHLQTAAMLGYNLRFMTREEVAAAHTDGEFGLSPEDEVLMIVCEAAEGLLRRMTADERKSDCLKRVTRAALLTLDAAARLRGVEVTDEMRGEVAMTTSLAWVGLLVSA